MSVDFLLDILGDLIVRAISYGCIALLARWRRLHKDED